MIHPEHQYLELLRHVVNTGDDRPNRTGVDTRGVFGAQMRFDLHRDGFPLITTKNVWFKGVVHELLWMLSGSTNIKYLTDNGVHIWDEWADENGELGPVYGAQWRSWWNPDGAPKKIDQIINVWRSLQDDPFSRRHIVSAWDVSSVDDMALPPCHMMFQFHVSSDKKLSCHLYQRSADLFLGVPFNIASYSLLTHMMAATTGLGVGEFVHSFGDAHIYHNHFSQVEEQLMREPRAFPTLVLNDQVRNDQVRTPVEFTYDDIALVGYEPHPAIKAEVAV